MHPLCLLSRSSSVLRNYAHQPLLFRQSLLLKSSLHHDDIAGHSSGTSVHFAMDPDGDDAKNLTAKLGLTPAQHDKLSTLSELVVTWNDRINLVSRKDCSKTVIFGRHILPSIAMMAMKDFAPERRVIDVGTGGGFPGLPLAIAMPNIDFLLVDSIGKKLKAVEAMAEELGLDNVHVHHGRAEEIVDDILEGKKHKGAYDVVVGRSVTSIPRFCFWITQLIKKDSGKLLYIIGGDIEDDVKEKAIVDVTIEDLLGQRGASDKKILVFSANNVLSMAAASGEVKRIQGKPNSKPRSNPKKLSNQAKGQWDKRNPTAGPKQRGYDNFQRYES
jgi:16S rRNA (guanine527-N7)-methyltransferase